MGTPDPHTSGNLLDALKYGGGGVVVAILTALVKNVFTADGKDAREMRGELREEIKRVRDQRDKLEEDVEELRDDLDVLRGERDEARVERMRADTRARQYLALLNEHEQRAGTPLTQWPELRPGPYTDPDDLKGGT